MGILTNIFYLISTSLLIPVMLALLWCLARVLLLLGQTLREHFARAGVSNRLSEFSRALEDGDERLPDLPAGGLVVQTLGRLLKVARNEVLAEKVLHEAELIWQAELGRLRGMARFGPSLGLMGTLIPLGPALVGLAAGDLEMMSSNLVIAFATTVVGLLVGTLAVALLGIKKRWYQADAILITFAAGRLPQLSQTTDQTAVSTDRAPGARIQESDPEAIAVSSGRDGEKEPGD
jgi:biopolymer transport protein ExbB/TolQ